MSENEYSEPLFLDVDLTQVETTRPAIKAGLVDLRIVSISKKPNKTETGHNAVIEFATTDMNESTTGKEVPPGFKMFSYYPMQNKADAKGTYDWKVNFAALQEAAFGEKQGNFDAAALIGQTVRASLKVTQHEGADSNEIGRLSQAV